MNNNRNLVIGDIVKFGNYYQYLKTQKQPIKWLVIDIKDNKAFLLSTRVLHTLEYTKKQKIINFFAEKTWVASQVREWLNHFFINIAFNDEEKEKIKTTTVVTYTKKVRQQNEVVFEEQPTTEDKIFILSHDEFEQYFIPNEYKTSKPTRVILNDVKTNLHGNCQWHLRTTSMFLFLFVVGTNGRVNDKGITIPVLILFSGFLASIVLAFVMHKNYNYIFYVLTCYAFLFLITVFVLRKGIKTNIRPAMWVDLNFLNKLFKEDSENTQS